MQDAGWKYKRGPEPFSNVYVPPDGSVRFGSVLGKDFFQDDHQLWSKAEQLGITDSESNDEMQDNVQDTYSEEKSLSSCEEEIINVRPRKKPVYISSPESCCDKSTLLGKQLDNTNLCEPSLALTEKSKSKISTLVSSFLSKLDKNSNFNRDLWLPLWRYINNEQGSVCEELAWRYTKSIRAGKLGRNHWYSPPNSVLGGKGEIGRDFFTTEEAVVAFLLRDLKHSKLITSSKTALDDFEIRLSRAMEEHLTFDEIRLSSNGKVKRRARKRNLQEAFPEMIVACPKPKSKRDKENRQMFSPPNGMTSSFIEQTHSQNTMKTSS